MISHRRYFALFLPFTFVVAFLAGCSGSVNIKPLVASSEALGICVVEAAAADFVDALTDPASLVSAIIGSCASYGVATVEQVLATIEEAIGAAPALPVADAGPGSVDGGPDAGPAGNVLPKAQVRLRKVRDAAAAIVASKAKAK